jgi:hypothetical protein
MSEPLATYAFLPWLRRGFAAALTRVEGGGTPEPRGSVNVEVRFNNDDALAGMVTLAMLGPGDISGLDPRAIVRMAPRPGVMDAEPNYFPLVEFDQADLPWRYTPARATSGERLTPWLMLIVLADAEIKRLTPSQDGRLGRIELHDAAVLPNRGQLWAWAHVQHSGASTIDPARAAQLLAEASPTLIARLMCPRRLAPRTVYTGLLVPTFQRGVLAGLGQPVPDIVDALAPAWTDGASGPIALPVYHQWRFGTGETGDFESLARLLKRFEAPSSVGIRKMDVSAPSPGLPAAATVPLGLRGMLESLGTADDPAQWEASGRGAWVAALKPLLNLPKQRLATPNAPRIVAPPLYGQWPAATDECRADDPNARPPWFQALSVDPRWRVGAALGTQVVQANQEALMASAWEQVERVRQLNEELRQAQLAREMASRLHHRHIALADPEAVLFTTAPLHARIKASPTTVRTVLAESAVPRGLFDGAFRRIARPQGPIRRRGGSGHPVRAGLIDRLNRGTLSAAPVPPVPSDLATPKRLGAGLVPPGVTPSQIAWRRRIAEWLLILAVFLLVIALGLLLTASTPAASSVAAVALVLWGLARRGRRRVEDLDRRVAFRDGTLDGDSLRATPPPLSFEPQSLPPGGAPPQLPAAPGGTAPDALRVAAFRESAAQLFDRIAAPTLPVRTDVSVDLPALRTTLVQALDPQATFAAAYRGRYTLTSTLPWRPNDPLEPILAAPEFEQPMYRELAKLSPDWLLPGLSEIPRNSVTLLRTNQAMVEAFMIGLNHEMARELLWREYPAEQRATFFRQFWDPSGAVPVSGQTPNAEALKDIQPIHRWLKDSALGAHRPTNPPPGGYLVLLIRGELLHRYPHTLVYAAKAKWLANGLRDIDDPQPGDAPEVVADKQRWPLFSGQFEPDASFFGFALTKEEVRGSSDRAAGRPGFFFVLQEHTDEPRFGLDEADPATLGRPVVGTNWDNLSWGSLVADAAALQGLRTIDLNSDLPDTQQVQSIVTRRWHADRGRGVTGSRSSDLACITFQRPMRVGIHGEDMVP